MFHADVTAIPGHLSLKIKKSLPVFWVYQCTVINSLIKIARKTINIENTY